MTMKKIKNGNIHQQAIIHKRTIIMMTVVTKSIKAIMIALETTEIPTKADDMTNMIIPKVGIMTKGDKITTTIGRKILNLDIIAVKGTTVAENTTTIVIKEIMTKTRTENDNQKKENMRVRNLIRNTSAVSEEKIQIKTKTKKLFSISQMNIDDKYVKSFFKIKCNHPFLSLIWKYWEPYKIWSMPQRSSMEWLQLAYTLFIDGSSKEWPSRWSGITIRKWEILAGHYHRFPMDGLLLLVLIK